MCFCRRSVGGRRGPMVSARGRALPARSGFTLVELLVVIAIIGILVALLLPAVNSARDAARRIQCVNTLKQIGLAVLNFESANKRLPAGSTSYATSIGGPYFSTWAVDILPYLEEQAVFDTWDNSVGFSHPNNRRLRETVMPAYHCPSDLNVNGLSRPESGPGDNMLWAHGSYRAMSGHSLGMNGDHYWDNPEASNVRHASSMPLPWRGPMHSGALNTGPHREFSPVKARQIVDGLSRTMLVGEYHTKTQPNRRSYWAYAYTSYNQSSAFFESRTLLPDYLQCVQIGGGGAHTCKRAWGSLHTGGQIQFVFCDGSVRSISPNVDMEIFVASATIANKEVVSLTNE